MHNHQNHKHHTQVSCMKKYFSRSQKRILQNTHHIHVPLLQQVDTLRDSLKETQKELDHTADRLHRGIEENEALCGRIRELERDLQDQVSYSV